MWFWEIIWEAVTFKDFRGSGDWMDFVLDVCMVILVAVAMAFVVAAAIGVAWTIYRLMAYGYKTETLRAKVTRKSYEAERTSSSYNVTLKMCTPTTSPAVYNVHIVTENGLDSVIDSERLYNSVEVGSRIQVVMKIGRSREAGHKIKYWRVVNYSW